MSSLLQDTPERFAAALRQRGTRRVALVREASGRIGVHPGAYAELARLFEHPESGYDDHEAVFLEVGRRSGALLAAFLHRTQRGQAQGGLRAWHYPSLAALLSDGLRLSRAMGRKNALADLWWGGGKGILSGAPGAEPGERRRRLQDYGDFVTSLRGCYVTAEDVGTTPRDLTQVFRRTRFVTCIPPELGGSGNPSRYTALGVVSAMEAALDVVGLGSLRGRRIAMQGGGNVGEAMIAILLERGVAEVCVAEVSGARCRTLRRRFRGAPVTVRPVEAGDASILAEICDVLAPNGVGGVLGPDTIPRVRARIVCGAANDPLADEVRDARALSERGIVYVPDFVANRLGIVHCANEQYGYVTRDPAIERHLDPSFEGSIDARVRQVLAAARSEGISTVEAAARLAAPRLCERHPIWGHRGAEIVRSLMEDRWYEGG